MGPTDVKISSSDIPEVLDKLEDKRTQVERELAKIPGAPSNRDVFQLCRGFERAFTYTIEKTDYSGLIRRILQDEGLAGAVAKLPLERKFKLDSVKEVIRISDGFQPHLVSPELGLRKLVHESIEMVLDPVSTAVRRVHQVLLDVAREASKKASLLLDSTILDDTRTPLKLPHFETAVMIAATKALELWRNEALEVARTIVAMEQGYVTAAFFRHRMFERYRQWEEQDRLGRMLDDGEAAPDDSDSENDSDTSPTQSRPNLDGDEMASSGGMAIPDAEPVARSREKEVAEPREKEPDFGGDLKTGYMEKRIGEHSNRQSLPESWKWQRRYWVLSEPKGLLYYFKSADDPPTYRGIINIRECRIEDVDTNGLPKTSSRSKYDLDGGGGAVSLLIKVSHKDPSKPAIKKHHSLVLRCESASEKYAWLARLKYVSETPATSRPIRKYNSNDLQDSRKGATEQVPKKEKREGRPPKAPASLQSAPSTPHVHAAMGGIGSTVLFNEDSKIGPEPVSYGLFSGDDPLGFDGFLQQLAEDTAAYVRTVCNTIVLTVPKAIVHCQVKRSERQMLEELYEYMSSLQNFEKESLMNEEPEIMQRRAAAKQAVMDIQEGIALIKKIMEERVDEPEHYLPASLLEMAGLSKLTPRHIRENSGPLYGDFTPTALRGHGNSVGHAQNGISAHATSTRAPPSNSVPQPRRPSVTISTTNLPRLSTPSTPTGPPNLSTPSPMPRRRPPAPPPGT